MSSDENNATGTSEEVLDYYAKNWEKIANCYDIDDKGLPIDPAWYRRRQYNAFLSKNKPETILDVGCGGGWTVLDALELGLDAEGIEPVAELQEHGTKLLQSNGHNGDRISKNDLSSLSSYPSNSFDCISLLSVLPHVPQEKWESVHKEIARILRPGGRLIAAYRNELFDLYTFNSLTLEFYDQSLWECPPCEDLQTESSITKLKGLISNPDLPGPYFTAAIDKSFGNLKRAKSNPLMMPSYLKQFGLMVENTKYYHYHCVPPLLAGETDNYREINHQMELSMADDWRGNFMAAIFMVEAVLE